MNQNPNCRMYLVYRRVMHHTANNLLTAFTDALDARLIDRISIGQCEFSAWDAETPPKIRRIEWRGADLD